MTKTKKGCLFSLIALATAFVVLGVFVYNLFVSAVLPMSRILEILNKDYNLNQITTNAVKNSDFISAKTKFIGQNVFDYAGRFALLETPDSLTVDIYLNSNEIAAMLNELYLDSETMEYISIKQLDINATQETVCVRFVHEIKFSLVVENLEIYLTTEFNITNGNYENITSIINQTTSSETKEVLEYFYSESYEDFVLSIAKSLSESLLEFCDHYGINFQYLNYGVRFFS